MKNKLLSAIFSLVFCMPAYSETNESLNTSQIYININNKNYSLESFVGQYNLLDYKVSILLKSSNKLFINFEDLPLSQDFMEAFSFFFNKSYVNDTNREFLLKEYPNASASSDVITFPYKKEYELLSF